MQLVHDEIAVMEAGKPRIELRVDRLTLAKRRWRGVAEDGREFGFDLEHPLNDRADFFETAASVYTIAQQPEDLFEIHPGDAAEAARIGWMIGNLHFPVAIQDGAVRVPADSAVRQLLERERVLFEQIREIFHPLKAAAGHHHHHHEH